MESTVMSQVQTKIVETMKSRDTIACNAYKNIKAELIKAQHSGENFSEIKILQKLRAQRVDAFDQYTAAGRADLAAVEAVELKIIESFLPAEAPEEVITEYVKEIAASIPDLSMKHMKNILTRVQEKYPTASGAVVSKTVGALCRK